MQAIDGFTEEQLEFILEGWLPALRSGNFEQGEGHLRRGDAYCCLGVACQVAGVEWSSTARVPGEMLFIMRADYGSRGNSSELPIDLARKIGVYQNGAFTPPYRVCNDDAGYDYDEYSSLVELNDDAGWDFGRIADFIEKELLNPDGEYSFLPVGSSG